MSIVAWDGKILAADKQCGVADTIYTMQKLWRLKSGDVIAVVGSTSNSMVVKRWYESGAKREEWPECQKNDNWAQLIVASKEGCFYFCNQPEPIKVLDQFYAWGVGREVALGAMEMGADAIKAVEIASKHISGCGRGCDYAEVNTEKQHDFTRKPIILKVNKKAFMEM